MAFMKFLGTVKVPKSAIIAVAILNSATTLQLPDMVVTSGNDSTHSVGSKHYTDEALDFRTKPLTADQKKALVVEVKRRLGPDYDVILEDLGQANEHLHIEADDHK